MGIIYTLNFYAIHRINRTNALKSDLKKPRICPIWGQSDPLWGLTYHPWISPSVSGLWVSLHGQLTDKESDLIPSPDHGIRYCPESNNSGAFSVQFSVHFDSLILKSSGFVTFGAILTQFEVKSDTPQPEDNRELTIMSDSVRSLRQISKKHSDETLTKDSRLADVLGYFCLCCSG